MRATNTTINNRQTYTIFEQFRQYLDNITSEDLGHTDDQSTRNWPRLVRPSYIIHLIVNQTIVFMYDRLTLYLGLENSFSGYIQH